VNTTVVAVVGSPGDDLLARAHGANVRVLASGMVEGAESLPRVAAARQEARRTAATYLLHDADPLGWVGDAWVRRFDGEGAAGELEVAVAETLARWRARTLDLPDYYLVVDPEDLSRTRRHWFLGVLGSAGPVRVAAVRADRPLTDGLAHLRTGPWWPPLDEVLAGIDRLVPDRAGVLPGSGVAADGDHGVGLIGPADKQIG
jgi:hypothetical protein